MQAKESSSSQAQAGSSGVTTSGATIRGALSGAVREVEIRGLGPGKRLWLGGKCGLEPSAAWRQRRRFGLVAGLRGLGRVLWAGSRATDSSDSSERFPEDLWCAQKFRIARGRCFTCTEQSSRLELCMFLCPKPGFVRESSEMGTYCSFQGAVEEAACFRPLQ